MIYQDIIGHKKEIPRNWCKNEPLIQGALISYQAKVLTRHLGSDNFMTKGFAESLLKAHQLQLGPCLKLHTLLLLVLTLMSF